MLPLLLLVVLLVMYFPGCCFVVVTMLPLLLIFEWFCRSLSLRSASLSLSLYSFLMLRRGGNVSRFAPDVLECMHMSHTTREEGVNDNIDNIRIPTGQQYLLCALAMAV